MKGSYTQLTVKFPNTKERYRQAVEYILDRDRAKYRTQAEYLTAAILFFEGSALDEQNLIRRMEDIVLRIDQKVDRLCNEEANG